MKISGGINRTFFSYRVDTKNLIKLHLFIERYWAKGNNSLCEQCNVMSLSTSYIYIIEKLKKAGLLPQDYKKICCNCYGYNIRERDGSIQRTLGRTEETPRNPER